MYVYHSSKLVFEAHQANVKVFCIDVGKKELEYKIFPAYFYAFADPNLNEWHYDQIYAKYGTREDIQKYRFDSIYERDAFVKRIPSAYHIDQIASVDIQNLIYECNLQYAFTAPSKVHINNSDIKPVAMNPKSMCKGYIDIEVYEEGIAEFPEAEEAKYAVKSISCFYENKLYTFILTKADDSFCEEIFKNGEFECNWTKYRYITEKELLHEALEFISNLHPALETGWNFLNFDFLYLFNRLERLGMPTSLLNGGNTIKIEQIGDKATKFDIKRRVKTDGCIYLDLREVYKLFMRTTLERTSLEAVAEKWLDMHKVSISFLTATDDEIAYYNAWDAVLCYLIDVKKCKDKEKNEKEPIFNYYEYVRSLSLTNLTQIFSVARAITHSMLIFAERFKIGLQYLCKGSDSTDDEKLAGAFVFENVAGRWFNVACLDFKSEYTSAIIAYNISGESLVEEEAKRREIYEKYCSCWYSRDFSSFDYYAAPYYNNRDEQKEDFKAMYIDKTAPLPLKHLIFFTKVDGFEKKYLTYLQEERYKIKEVYLNKAFKVYLNGVYGAFKSMGFFLRDIRKAQATTSLSRLEMLICGYVCEITGRKQCAGDTDSNYVKLLVSDLLTCKECKHPIDFDSLVGFVTECPFCGKPFVIDVPGFADWVIGEIRSHLQEFHPCFASIIKIELEEHLKIMITVAKMKRYVCYKIDGSEIIRGFEKKKVNSNYVTRNCQTDVMYLLKQDWTNEECSKELLSYCRAFKKELKKMNYYQISSTFPFAHKIEDYKTKGKYPAHIQSMLFSTANFGMHFSVLDKFYCMDVNRIRSGAYNIKEPKYGDNRVAFYKIEDLPADFEKYFEPDYETIYKRDFVNKVKDLVEIVGLSTKSFENHTLNEFVATTKSAITLPPRTESEADEFDDESETDF